MRIEEKNARIGEENVRIEEKNARIGEKNARIQKTLLRRLKSKTTKFCVDSLKNASIHRKCVDSKQIKKLLPTNYRH